MLRVELPQSARRSEAHAPETVQGNGSFTDTLISLLCGIVCNNEQYNKTVGKASPSIYILRTTRSSHRTRRRLNYIGDSHAQIFELGEKNLARVVG